jgi:hypothetical protein
MLMEYYKLPITYGVFLLFPQLISAVNKKETVFLLFIQQLFSSKLVQSFL